jgi:hypothetical protein
VRPSVLQCGFQFADGGSHSMVQLTEGRRVRLLQRV